MDVAREDILSKKSLGVKESLREWARRLAV